jgi:mannosyltransferase
LAVALVAATVELVWRLGASSLFVDEVYSWRAASVSLGELFHRVRVDEVTPPGYYVVLHGWIGLFGSDSESTMRALSVVAALALVAAVYWVADLLAGNLVGFLAALLTAVSPLVVEYGQEVRAYAWTMLAVTVAVGGVLESERRREQEKCWLAIAAIAAASSLWLHYTAILVLAPLAAYLIASRETPLIPRLGFALAPAVAGAGMLPLLIDQLHYNGNDVAPFAQLTSSNLVRVLGSPFDRTYPLLSAGDATLSAILVVVAIAVLMLPRAGAQVRHPRLLAGLAAFAPLVLLLLTLAGVNVLISRYDAVAVPFMVIAVAASVVTFLPAGTVIAAYTLLIALPESWLAHDSHRAYPDTRAAMQLVAQHWRSGEVLVIGDGYPGLGFNLQYYAAHLLPAHAVTDYNQDRRRLIDALTLQTSPIHRIAVITQPVATPSPVAVRFARAHWRVIAVRQLGGDIPLQVLTATRTTAQQRR